MNNYINKLNDLETKIESNNRRAHAFSVDIGNILVSKNFSDGVTVNEIVRSTNLSSIKQLSGKVESRWPGSNHQGNF
jgi:hypothetical protein